MRVDVALGLSVVVAPGVKLLEVLESLRDGCCDCIEKQKKVAVDQSNNDINNTTTPVKM